MHSSNVQIINRRTMGYDKWLTYIGNSHPKNVNIIEFSNGKVFNIHPFIRAGEELAVALSVEVGDWVAGVRWTS